MSDDSSPEVPASPGPADPSTGEVGFTPGERVAGRYEVLGTIGRGGMGVVYRVRDHELEEVVALKILHRGLVQSAEMLARFRREVKLARKVTHRNVARTFDIGEHAGDRFLTMELIDGEPLATILERSGPLGVTRAIAIATQMAEGMAAAHDVGVVHRDLKPANVSVAADGRVVLMDFGIARMSLDDPLQTIGQTWGTPAYMAPEQVVASPDVDARADIYAFGAVLFEMLTGRQAWTGPSSYAIASARLTAAPPDPREHRPELPYELGALVRKCLGREKEERFADARTLQQALRDLPSSDSPTAATPAPKASVAPTAATEPARRPVSTGSVSPAGTDRFARRTGTEGIREDIAQQLVLMGSASPSYRRILQELDVLLAGHAGRDLLAGFERVWQKRSFEGPYERPLLFLAALRADARAEGRSHPLFQAIAADAPDERAVTAQALEAAVGRERIAFWITLRSRRIQTNELTRSVTWLWPAAIAGAGDRARPLMLFDVGASAGLNLVADRVDVSWRRSSGEPLVVSRELDVRVRAGFDPRPLDVRRKDDCEWLRACVWPEQRERFARLDAAIAAFVMASPTPELALARASSVPARLEEATKKHPGRLAIVFQTLVGGYIPHEERAVYEEGMRAWLAAGPRGERMWALLELEEMGRADTSCTLDVLVGTGGGVEIVHLGRTSYHPQTVEVAPGSEERLRALTR